jgi:uncharacterized protein with HEPN domain
MEREPQAYLWDVCEAADAIAEFTTGLNLEDYLADRKLRAAVERQFEILGEALNQPKYAGDRGRSSTCARSRLPNLLIHGYVLIDHPTVWETVQSYLPPLRRCVAGLLEELGSTPANP